jgi:hypothetical protein
VVVEDRLEKDKERKRLEQEKFELLASIKVNFLIYFILKKLQRFIELKYEANQILWNEFKNTAIPPFLHTIHRIQINSENIHRIELNPNSLKSRLESKS